MKTILPNDGTLAVLRTTLHQASVRAAVAASNMANVDTPGYRATEARFPELAPGALPGVRLDRTDSEHFGPSEDGPEALITEGPITRMRTDGNTVDVDLEMTRFASVQGRYKAASQMVRKRFALMRYAVEGMK